MEAASGGVNSSGGGEGAEADGHTDPADGKLWRIAKEMLDQLRNFLLTSNIFGRDALVPV